MGTSVSMAASVCEPPEHFGRIRVWGTVGFALLVIGFPPVLDRAQAARGLVRQPGGPSEPGLELIFYVAAGLSLAAACVAWRLPREGSSAVRSRRGDVRLLLRHRPYRRLLCFSFLAQLCLQAPIQLFAPFIVAHGGSIDTVSRMWIPMLLLEIPLIFYSGATLSRVGVRGLLAIGVIADGSRWLICSLVSDLSVIYALQLLHGVVIAGLFVGSALYAESAVPERLLHRAGPAGDDRLRRCGGAIEHLRRPAAPALRSGRTLPGRRHRRAPARRCTAADPAPAKAPRRARYLRRADGFPFLRLSRM
jgi:hypothetical protein